jgi:hypothetical protein
LEKACFDISTLKEIKLPDEELIHLRVNHYEYRSIFPAPSAFQSTHRGV